MINLRNKNIIVTGASGGIGNSIVKKLRNLSKMPQKNLEVNWIVLSIMRD